MKNISLNIGERLSLVNVLNVYSKDLSLNSYRLAFKIVDKLEISEEERKKVGYEVVEDVRITWKDVEYIKVIELSNDEFIFIESIFDKKDKDSKFSIADGRELLSIIDKMEENQK